MRLPTLYTVLAIALSARGLPLPSDSSIGTSSVTLFSETPSVSSISSSANATVVASATDSSVSSTDVASSVSVTDPTSPTDSSVVTISTATDSLVATATDSDSSPSATDSTDSTADATATDTSDLPTSTDDASATDSSSFATATVPVDPASSVSSDAASPTGTGVSFDIPTNIPPACLALPSGIATFTPSLTSESAAPSATDSSIVDSSSAGSSTSDASATDSATADPSATGSFNATSTDLSVPSVSASFSAAANVTATATSTATNDSSSAAAALPTDGSTNSTLSKRIAQTDLPDVAQSWQDLCLASGGDIFTNQPCVTLAGIDGINALLGDADPCAQQDNADAMIDFAKSLGVTNGDALIANAVAYRQHPRNAFNINGVVPATPYCQRAPRNAELQGVVNSQLDGVNPGVYGSVNLGLFAFGGDGTCPFGQTPDVSSCSCS